jgi:hypothetical protein
MVITDPETVEAVFRMQRRYAKQWNDIELDRSRSLSEHTHEVCGAKVIGGDRRFTLHAQQDDKVNWILEVLFSRGFSEWYPGWSFGKNGFRSVGDIKGVHLHWSDGGKEAFSSWLTREKEVNQNNPEHTEYQSKPRRVRNA